MDDRSELHEAIDGCLPQSRFDNKNVFPWAVPVAQGCLARMNRETTRGLDPALLLFRGDVSR